MRRSLKIANFTDNKRGMCIVSFDLTATAKYSQNKTELRTGGNKA
jgi:hypothetical protein